MFCSITLVSTNVFFTDVDILCYTEENDHNLKISNSSSRNIVGRVRFLTFLFFALAIRYYTRTKLRRMRKKIVRAAHAWRNQVKEGRGCVLAGKGGRNSWKTIKVILNDNRYVTPPVKPSLSTNQKFKSTRSFFRIHTRTTPMSSSYN